MAIPVWQPSTLYPTGSIVRSTADLAGGAFNDVDNGGFETGTLADWTYQSVGGSVVAQVANTNARTGLYAFYWPGGAGTGQEGGVECFATSDDAQPVTPGLSVTAKGWFRYNTIGDIDGSQARMYLQWYGAGMTPLSTSPGSLIKGRGNNNKWVESVATGIAPAGAEFVAAAFWVVGRGGRGHVYVDDITWNYTTPNPPEGLVFKAVQPGIGTSDATEPVWPTVNGLQVTDGTVIWEALIATRITYRAVPILKSGTVEPTWPTTVGESVADNTISWQASTRQVVQAPNSKVWAITASKVYAADGDIIKFSATVNPLDWETADDAGYLPSGLNQNGSNDTAVLNIYRSSLVSFSSTTFQNWQVDPDPANMSLLDVMEGIGSTWQHAAQPVAKDLFYLGALGVRTVGISAGSTNLVNGDVGMPIDPLVRDAMKSAELTGGPVSGLYYPSLGQYWLTFGEFPPDPISIAGDVPDLWGIGMPMDYSYSGTGGAGELVFSIFSGSLPPGWTLNDDGSVAGTTVVPGTYTWQVIATDIIGNTSTPLDDETVIDVVPMFASAGTNLYRGIDPFTWDAGDFIDPPNITSIVFATLLNGRLFAFGTPGNAGEVSSDYGATWQSIIGIGSVATAQNSMVYTDAGEYIFFCQYGECYASTDGLNFSARTIGTGNSLGTAKRGSIIVNAKNMFDGNIRVSLNDGISFSNELATGVSGGTNIVVDIGDRFAVFGSAGGLSTNEMPGTDPWVAQAGYTATSTISAAYNPDTGRLAAMDSAGVTWYSDDKGVTWNAGGTISATTFMTAQQMVVRSGVFIVVVDGGEIWTSPDVVNWTKRLDLVGPGFTAIT